MFGKRRIYAVEIHLIKCGELLADYFRFR